MEEDLKNEIEWLKDKIADMESYYESIIAEKNDEINELQDEIRGLGYRY